MSYDSFFKSIHWVAVIVCALAAPTATFAAGDPTVQQDEINRGPTILMPTDPQPHLDNLQKMIEGMEVTILQAEIGQLDLELERLYYQLDALDETILALVKLGYAQEPNAGTAPTIGGTENLITIFEESRALLQDQIIAVGNQMDLLVDALPDSVEPNNPLSTARSKALFLKMQELLEKLPAEKD
jgi:hypothetical protein